MKRLPADTSAAALRLAARFVAKVAESLPEQKPVALSLLDRAAKLGSEDEETKALEVAPGFSWQSYRKQGTLPSSRWPHSKPTTTKKLTPLSGK